MGDVLNGISGINAAFAKGLNPQPNFAAKAKEPSQRELRDEARRAETKNNTLLNAAGLTGGKLNQETLSEAEEKLANAPSALKLARSGESLRTQLAELPDALASQRNQYSLLSSQIRLQGQQIDADFSALAKTAKEQYEDLGLEVPADIKEKMEQLRGSYAELEKNNAKLDSEFTSSTTALLLRNDQIKEAIKQKSLESQAFIKDAAGKVGQSSQKPVKVRPANFTIESGDDSGE